MPHLRDQQNQLDNLEAAIKLREADLANQASKNTVPKDEYDRVVALLARTQQDLADARQVMMAVGSQLLTQARGEAGAGTILTWRKFTLWGGTGSVNDFDIG